MQWKSGARTLTFNKVFKKWNYSVDLTKDENALKEHKIEPDKNVYISRAQSVLSSLGLQTANLPGATAEVHFMRLEKGELTETSNPTTAQFIQVNIFFVREAVTPKESIIKAGKRVDNPATPIKGTVYRDNPKLGSASVIISDRGDNVNNLYGFETIEWEVDPNFEVYNIVSADEAWQRIQEGKGFLKYLIKEERQPLSKYEPLQVKRFTTSNEKISFGYFESESYNTARPYQTPMYIFEGRAELADGNEAEFMFFVDALK